MIYFDNASTTKLNKKVIDEINNINSNFFFNPSSLYKRAVELNTNIQNIKSNLLNKLGASVFDNIIFTSSATESNNMTLRGVLKKNGKLVTTMGEHPSIFNLAKQLQNEGFNVEFANITSQGVVDIEDLKTKLKDATVLSLIHVSNETGAINDLENICKIAKSINPKIIIHSDGVQAIGKTPVNLTRIGVDIYTISGHKINGPKGIGALFVKNNISLKPLLLGGAQEDNKRAGTENVSGIFGIEQAINIAIDSLNDNFDHVYQLSNYLKNNLDTNIAISLDINNSIHSPYINVISIAGINSETILYLLEEKGFIVGNGSACSSKISNNRILDAMGMSKNFIDSSIRVSFSYENTLDEVKSFINELNNISKNYKLNFRK